MPLESLHEALEDEDDDALEALWDDIECEMDAVSDATKIDFLNFKNLNRIYWLYFHGL